jgi:tRNA(Ile)-lysidine synthetase-like protein
MEHGTGHETSTTTAATTITTTTAATTTTTRDTPVIVSLSGGVDSMVIASVLAYLRDEGGFSQLYIVAVHIDYGNRPESSDEASYVRHYAMDILRLEQCIVRRIDEVTRGVTKRDEYEKFSRNVRYDLYRQTVEECIKVCNECNPLKQVKEVGVMLGHHRGDVVENVISNSNKGCGPLDLSGMTALSKNDGVTIYRPLLPLEKSQVYEYSHKFGVPYFKDTTPHWSTRGKLRNKLIPLLEEVYGDGCLSNLATLAKESDEARAMFNETALKPFMAKVQRFPMGIIFSTKEFLNQGEYFWKIVLRDLLHSAGLGMFSDKSTDSFLKRIMPKNVTSGELEKNHKGFLHAILLI